MAKDIYSEEQMNHSRLGERRKFVMADVSGRGREVIFEVNWNNLVKRKGYIKISIDGLDCVVSREHLWSILFMLGSAEEQTKMVTPFMKKTRVTKYFKMLGITTSKDIRKGEMLNVPLDFTYNPEDHTIVIGKGSVSQMQKAVRSNIIRV